MLLRADSAYYGQATVAAALKAGAAVSITARQDPAVKRAIGSITENAWTKIKHTDAIYDPDTDTWTSDAEVAEIPFTAFTSKPKKDQVPGRVVVRRIPELNKKMKLSQPTLHSECCLTRPGRHRVQPHPPPRPPADPHLRDDSDNPTATDQHPGKDRVLRATHPTPPPRSVAMGNSMVNTVQPRPAVARLPLGDAEGPCRILRRGGSGTGLSEAALALTASCVAARLHAEPPGRGPRGEARLRSS